MVDSTLHGKRVRSSPAEFILYGKRVSSPADINLCGKRVSSPADINLYGKRVGSLTETTLYNKRVRPLETFLLAVIYGAASISILLLMGIVGYIFFKGFRIISWNFLTTVTSTLKKTVGIAGNIVNTLYIVVLTLFAATPIGVGAAIYLSEYSKPGRLVDLIEFTIETLSGIPSIIFGLFGMIFFGEVLGLGYSLLAGSFTLALMVLPFIIRNTQEALKAVPDSYRNGALGMGASKWHMIRTILLPSAMPGVLTGIILSVGRIVGESAALLFTAGSGRLLPKSGEGFWDSLGKLGGKVLESGGTLTVELYLQMQNGKYEVAFGVGCVLIILVLFINLAVKFTACRLRRV